MRAEARLHAGGEQRDECLLSSFRCGDSLFSSPSTHLHARGIVRTISTSVDAGLLHDVHNIMGHVASDTCHVPLLGALPFDSGGPARLWLPEQAVFASGRARTASPAIPAVCHSGPARLRPEPSEARFQRSVVDALQRIAGGQLDKVVLSRSLRISARVDVPHVLQRLLRCSDRGYTFAIDLGDHEGASACLVGASPELLLSRRGDAVASNPLAGSIARAPLWQEDAQRAEALLASCKDRHEHALVVDAVAAALGPLCRELHVPSQPSLLATPTMWHLSSRIHGRLRKPLPSALELALALHPTPAVCGYPTAAARTAIGELEGYDRGLFTGLVGWCDAHGDGEWAVTIRCALIEATRATLYAGAGIVVGSQPQAELAETNAKLRTMLDAMGLASESDIAPRDVQESHA